MADDPQTTPAAQSTPEVAADAPAAALVHSLDSAEVTRQIEELTSVVLDSAEVSTRSASIAADISGTLRDVVTKIQENNRRNVLHSRIILAALVACLVMSMGVFFAVTLKMSNSIKELDTMIYAMAKRVIEVDASMTAISKTRADFSELTEKQQDITATQSRLASRLEEVSRSIAELPARVADQSSKLNEPKFAAMQRDLQGLSAKMPGFESKLQALDADAQSVDGKVQTIAQSLAKQQILLQDLQKIRQNMEAGNLKTQQLAERALSRVDALIGPGGKSTAAAERLANQRAAAEQAALERSDPDHAAHLAAQKAAAQKRANYPPASEPSSHP
jgi:hypothetical protein